MVVHCLTTALRKLTPAGVLTSSAAVSWSWLSLWDTLTALKIANDNNTTNFGYYRKGLNSNAWCQQQ
jgi:hypothetical protein